MPDGDQYNSKLKPRYFKSYEMLCEDKFSSDEIERKLLEKLKQSIREIGDGMFGYLLKENNRTDLVSMTESCDSYHRKSYGQCGYCSSCLLRRLSLASAGLKESNCYVVPHGQPPKGDPTKAYKAMLAQVRAFENIFATHKNTTDQWRHLTVLHTILDDVVHDLYPTKQQFDGQPDARISFLTMYKAYVQEWMKAEAELSDGIISWTKPNSMQSNEKLLNQDNEY